MKRPNFYILLGLDPSERDPAKIERAINEKQTEWSRERNHPFKARAAQRNLELIGHMRELFADPYKRNAEAREAEKIRKEQQGKANEELDEIIDILASSGYLLEKQVKNLAERFEGWLTEEEIRRRIKVPIRVELPRDQDAKPMLRRQLMRQIRDRLQLIDKEKLHDLYDFLGRPRNSRVAALFARAKQLDAEIRRINRKTAEVTASQELIGHCLSIFKTDEERAKYDNAMDQQRLSELLKPYLETAGAGGVLQSSVVAKLLRKAQEHGIAVDKAEAYVMEFANRRRLSVQFIPQPKLVPDQRNHEPESLITYVPRPLGSRPQYYSCFISYNHNDKCFARRLHEALRERGIRCWLDDHQMLPGDDIYEQVDRGIRLWDKILLCASKHSLTSWWVDTEIETAFNKEQKLMKKRGVKVLALIPLDLDGYLFSDQWQRGYKTQVLSRLAADFRGWESDNKKFQKQFEKVVKALQSGPDPHEPPPRSHW